MSDMFAVAYKTGGEERVLALADILLNLPDEWWEFRGCRNWLKVAIRQIQDNREKFMSDLEKYAKSKDWLEGKPFITIDEG